MGAFNVVVNVPATCPRCSTRSQTGVQFKYGSTWQYQYLIGETLRWGGNDIGRQGTPSIVADGEADSDCPVCGYEGTWPFYVFIDNDRIVGVSEADGTFDFGSTEDTYLERDIPESSPPGTRSL
ncbi:MAG: hypothetical protein ACTHU0_16740 [Kofleriaceae bacterium]